MYEVELGIPATTDLLPVFLLFRKRFVFVPGYNRQVGGNKRIATGFCELHPELQVPFFIRPLVIIKNATNTPALMVAVKVYKIVIAFLFELGVQHRVKLIACVFISTMKMPRIFFKKIIGCQVGATTKPP